MSSLNCNTLSLVSAKKAQNVIISTVTLLFAEKTTKEVQKTEWALTEQTNEQFTAVSLCVNAE